ncbi:hypothetical protein K438DRAFT_1775785 [Mycena galopus ATCC 62051]|nr:hypothetical protein K438DRAFT_1775785 [Mycena galopus ATCC 62051]
MPPTRCDCIVNCNHQDPEITIATRYNHRKDEKIENIRAALAGNSSINDAGYRGHFQGRRIQHPRTTHSAAPGNSLHTHPYPAAQHPPSQSGSRRHLQPQGPEPLEPVPHHNPPPASSTLTGKTEAALKLMGMEVRARASTLHTSLATPLVFANNPENHGVYNHVPTLVVNSVNANFLEHENRLWELMGQAHILPPCRGKNELEDRIWREIDRCSMEKELHWNQQRMHLDIDQVVVNNEIHFMKIPQQDTAIFVSLVVTAMMTEFYFIPRTGGSVLLAGLRDMLRQWDRSSPFRIYPVTLGLLFNNSALTLSPKHIPTVNPVTKSHPNPDIPVCQDRLPLDDICGEQLWKKEKIHGKVHCTPHLTYVHQLVKNWLGRVLSRPGIEDILDDYPKAASVDQDGVMSDIWGSPTIKSLRDLTVVTSTGFFLVLLNFPTHLRHLFENMCYLGSAPTPNSPSVGRLNPFMDLIVRDFLEFWAPGVFFTRTHKYRQGRHTKAMVIPLTADMLAARAAAGFTSHTSTYFCIGCHITIADIEELNPARWPTRNHDEHLQHAYAWKNANTVEEQEKLAKDNGIRFTPLLNLPYWSAREGGDGSEPRVQRPPRPSLQRTQKVLELFVRYRDDPNIVAQILKNEWANFKTLWHICNDLDLRVSGKRRDWFVQRIKEWADQNQITDAELLKPPAPRPLEDSVETLKLVAIGAVAAAASDLDMNEAEVEEAQKLMKQIYRGTLFTSVRAKANIYMFACRVRNIPLSGTPTRLEMHTKLASSIAGEKQAMLSPGPTNGGPVLGKDVMNIIWTDMHKTILPSWIGAAPRNWGTKKRGKLSADHSRTIFTIHLPISLIWLWRNEVGRKKDLLVNMTQLVTAIQVANFKTTDPEISWHYHHQIIQYMAGITHLFREDNITPSQHSPAILERIYGNLGHNIQEVRSFTSDIFITSSAKIQIQNMVKGLGEMEATFVKSTARAANLKAMLADDADIRSRVLEAVTTYDRLSTQDSRGVRLAQMLDIEDTHFDLEAHSKWGALSGKSARFYRTILSGNMGVRYTGKNVLKRDQDSYIIFNVPDTDEDAPGEILKIFQYWHTTPENREFKATYLVVNRFRAAILDSQDPYPQLGPNFGHLCSVRPMESRVIEASHVKSHFGLTPIHYNGQDIMHVFPLSRVAQGNLWSATFSDHSTEDSEDEQE